MFWWINPLFTAGKTRTIQPEDLPPLNEEDTILHNLNIFKRHWEELHDVPDSRSRYALALWRTTGRTYIISCFMTFMMSVCALTQPLLLQLLISHLSREDDNTRHSNALDNKILLIKNTGTFDWIFDLHAWKLKQQLGMRARGISIAFLYEKTIVMSSSSKSKLTDGKIVNTMSTDCNRIEWVYYFSDYIISSSFLFFGIIILLYLMFGWSALVGASVTLLGMPLMTFLGKTQAKFTRKKMVDTDARLDLTRQMLLNMRVVKFYTWEQYFQQRIEEVREKELSKIKWIKYTGALISMIGQSLPTLMALTCFAVFTALEGGTLVAADAISAMFLFNMLKNPFFVIPRAIRTIMEAYVSLERIGEILDADEIEKAPLTEAKSGSAAANLASDPDLKPGEIRFNGETLYFEKTAEQPAMEDVKLRVAPGSLTMCLGAFGSGKSFLLSAILGEIFHSRKGEEVDVDRRQACPRFCGRRRHRRSSSSSSNRCGGAVILMMMMMMMMMMMIRSTEEGKRSQRTDSTSSVSSALSASPSGVAYVPQTAWILNATVRDNILFGSPYDKKKYKETVVACALVKDLEALKAGDLTEIGERGVTLSGGQKQRLSIARAVYKRDECDVFLFDDPLSALDAHVTDWIFKRVILKMLKGKTRVLVTHQIHYSINADQVIVMKTNTAAAAAAAVGQHDELMDKKGEYYRLMSASSVDEKKKQQQQQKKKRNYNGNQSNLPSPSSLIDEEDRAEGAVSSSVYLDYFQKGGSLSWGFVFICSVMILVSYRLSDLWVTRWTSGGSDDNGDSRARNMYYLSVYAGIAGVTLFVSFVSGIGMAYLSIVSSKFVHSKLLRNLQAAPMAFFDTTPTGRITNRFSRDMDAIDQNLAMEIYWFIRTLFQAISMVIVIAVTIIYFTILAVPLAVLYYNLMQYYRGASRDVKRIDSISKSPIFTHFSTTLEGLSSIRAFGQADRFKHKIIRHTEANMRAFYMSSVVGVWLPMQLSILGLMIQFIITAFCVALKLEPAIAGLCISYGASFCLWLQSTIQALTSLERSMNAVERTNEYSAVPSEGAKWQQPKKQQARYKVEVDEAWPREGAIRIKNCDMRYRDGLPLVLRGLDVTVDANMKIGICGRTGAGKSSLVALLMRLCEAETQGMVIVDGHDISAVPLKTLRSKISVIPQDPIVFPATIKANLDPYEDYSDEEIMQTIEMVHLGEWVRQVGGLEYEISSGSDEMSLGQKQLLCMARALLSRPKILILDEATASIDYRTDQLIQKMVTEEFKAVTVLTIAHRIDTILHYDRILVMDQGSVAEFGPPEELLKRGGIFASLMRESREARRRSIAEA
eukprot:jgi/Bigna1/46166/estExt_Genewise1.C_20256